MALYPKLMQGIARRRSHSHTGNFPPCEEPCILKGGANNKGFKETASLGLAKWRNPYGRITTFLSEKRLPAGSQFTTSLE